MPEREAPTVQWPTYALRAWLTAVLGQLERAGEDLDARVEDHEKEITRLRAQRERSATVITSLREAVGSVDETLRRTRDTPEEPESRQSESRQSRREARERSQEAKQEPEKPSPTSTDRPQPNEGGKS